jgi:hypothetical protein
MERIRCFLIFPDMTVYLTILFILPGIYSQQQQVPMQQPPLPGQGINSQQQQVPLQHVPMQQPPLPGQMLPGQVPQHVPMQQPPLPGQMLPGQVPQQLHAGQVPQQMHGGQVPQQMHGGQMPINSGPPPMTVPLFDETADDAPAVAMEYKVHVDPGKEECNGVINT